MFLAYSRMLIKLIRNYIPCLVSHLFPSLLEHLLFRRFCAGGGDAKIKENLHLPVDVLSIWAVIPQGRWCDDLRQVTKSTQDAGEGVGMRAVRSKFSQPLFSQTKTLRFGILAKVNGNIPSAFPPHYEEALRDDDKRSRAAVRVCSPAKASVCSKVMPSSPFSP